MADGAAAAAPAVAQGLASAFGGSKDSGSTSTISPYAALAAHIGKQIEKEVDPLRAQFLHMLLQVVTQGGSAVGTPLSNQATAASMSAANQSQQQAATDLARTTGGTANPAIEAILNSMRQQSSMATSAIPTEIGASLLNLVPGAVSSAQGGVGQMIGEAIGGNYSRTGSSSAANFSATPPKINPFAFFSNPNTAQTGAAAQTGASTGIQ